MTTILKCLACGATTPIHRGRTSCPCGRSVARMDEIVVEIQGPARILVPADELTTIDGLPWMTLPEDPMVIRRDAVAPLV